MTGYLVFCDVMKQGSPKQADLDLEDRFKTASEEELEEELHELSSDEDEESLTPNEEQETIGSMFRKVVQNLQYIYLYFFSLFISETSLNTILIFNV